MIVLLDGISLIPKIGIHTQKIPPITSVKDKSVSSAAGIVFDPIEYKIKPRLPRVNISRNCNNFFFGYYTSIGSAKCTINKTRVVSNIMH